MKRLFLVFFMMIGAQFVFGQRLFRDHTYSTANYKHPNKAAYARKFNLDKSIPLESTVVERNDNYKQPASKKITTATAIPQTTVDRSRKSYKHPMGL